MDAMSGRLVASNGIELWVEVDGPDDGAPVVLLGGADATVLRWPSTLLDALERAGRRVVRIEHRDTGLSTKIDPDHPYRLDALAADVIGVLAELGIDRADLVGYSMGGAVAQVVALDHPHLVRGLIVVGSTPGAGDDRLPPPADWFVDAMAERLFAPPPRSFDDRVTWTAALYRLLAGSRYEFDEDAQRALAAAEVSRAWVPESGHGIAVQSSPSRLDALDRISAPTVVVHGTEDPVYPPAHGEALAAGIPGAALVLVEGLGHEVPEGYGEELAALVLGIPGA
jgi:pimeloyl-ACP methyl ester carboxylesterase